MQLIQTLKISNKTTLASSAIVGFSIVAVVAVGKEIADYIQMKTLDPTNPNNRLIFHIFDVIVTILGGVLAYIIMNLIG